jgi:hypothetical protein
MAFSSPPGGGAPNYQVAIPATANNGLLSLGPGPWDGSSAGHFSGSASGSALAINVPSGFAGHAIDVQQNGAELLYLQGSALFVVGGFNATGDSTFGTLSTGGIHWGFAADIGDVPHIVPKFNTMLMENQGSVAYVPVTIKGMAAQTGDLFQAQSSTAAVLSGTRADGLVYSTLRGLATRVKAGAPVDADWAVAPPDGTIVGDSTNSKVWIRLSGTWKGVVVA